VKRNELFFIENESVVAGPGVGGSSSGISNSSLQQQQQLLPWKWEQQEPLARPAAAKEDCRSHK